MFRIFYCKIYVFYRASYALAVYAMAVCLCLSVCHKSVFC